MATGTTVTCVCGSRGFVVVHAVTGEPIDLKTIYTTVQRPINPRDLKSHDPIDLSTIRTVCANPDCRRPL
jgi:hypothetical protein